MSAALLPRRLRRRRPSGLPRRERLRPADHIARLRTARAGARGANALALEDLIVDAWEALSVHEAACCPLCGGEMERGGGGVAPRGTVPGNAPHGKCMDCGTQLS
jgi:tRNA(Ile2) C34 agmatinyltransferase TiaS